MKREEILAGYLEVLDEINQSTHLALETLNNNAATTRMIIDHILHGAQEAPSVDFGNLNFEAGLFEETNDDELEAMADKIVKQIRETDSDEPGILAVSIDIDPSKHDPDEVMKLVHKKLSGETTKAEKPKEDLNDGFNFDNPLE